MKIVAMLPVKNEQWVLEHCLKSLSFCDEIIAIDDNSTDRTLEILNKYNCRIIPFKTDTSVGWKEYDIRKKLLEEARSLNATHLVAIDADEMFGEKFVSEAKGKISELKAGETIALPWVNVVDENNILMPIFNKIFIMADDGVSNFKEGFIHIPRLPKIVTTKNLNLPYSVLHFQYVNKQRNDYKKSWYMMSEYLKKDRGALRINTTYSIVNTFKKVPFNVSDLSETKLPNPNLDTSVWQKKEVFKLFSEYGADFFEPLQIWDNVELKDYFKEKYLREPQPTIPLQILISVNSFKNNALNWLKSFLR